MPLPLPRADGRRRPLPDPATQLAALAGTGVPPFDEVLTRHRPEPLQARAIEVLQVNVGRFCNLRCAHCHVDAGPDRGEMMSRATAEQVIELLRRQRIPTLDITGGAPELNAQFRFLVSEGQAQGCHVIDRCNLAVLLLSSQPDLVGFLAEHKVEVLASLPSFREAGTDAQRGARAFERSIEGLRLLNAAGYGRGTGLLLNLVHNPVGAFLPGCQASLERDYRRELAARHGVVFDRLYSVTNMPISRFLDQLERRGGLQRYMERLVGSFNPRAADAAMCRKQLSVGWDGTLYDCDFNQMLELRANHGAPSTIEALLAAGHAIPRRIVTDRHCFGCTAGAGSSCGGETVR